MSDTIAGGVPDTPEEVAEAAVFQHLPTSEGRMTHIAQTQEEEEAATVSGAAKESVSGGASIEGGFGGQSTVDSSTNQGDTPSGRASSRRSS